MLRSAICLGHSVAMKVVALLEVGWVVFGHSAAMRSGFEVEEEAL